MVLFSAPPISLGLGAYGLPRRLNPRGFDRESYIPQVQTQRTLHISCIELALTNQSAIFYLRYLLSEYTIAVLRLCVRKGSASETKTSGIFQLPYISDGLSRGFVGHDTLYYFYVTHAPHKIRLQLESGVMSSTYDGPSTPLFLFRHWNYVHLNRGEVLILGGVSIPST